MATGMDALAIGRFLLHKGDQRGASAVDVESYLGAFELD